MFVHSKVFLESVYRNIGNLHKGTNVAHLYISFHITLYIVIGLFPTLAKIQSSFCILGADIVCLYHLDIQYSCCIGISIKAM